MKMKETDVSKQFVNTLFCMPDFYSKSACFNKYFNPFMVNARIQKAIRCCLSSLLF